MIKAYFKNCFEMLKEFNNSPLELIKFSFKKDSEGCSYQICKATKHPKKKIGKTQWGIILPQNNLSVSSCRMKLNVNATSLKSFGLMKRYSFNLIWSGSD